MSAPMTLNRAVPAATCAPGERRPYWIVDAKWIAALLFVPVFCTAMLVNDAVVATSERGLLKTLEVAVEQAFEPIRHRLETLTERYQRELGALPLWLDTGQGIDARLDHLGDTGRGFASELKILKAKIDAFDSDVEQTTTSIALLERSLSSIDGRLHDARHTGALLEREAGDLLQQRLAALLAELYEVTGIHVSLSTQDLRRLPASAIVRQIVRQAAEQFHVKGAQAIAHLEREIGIDRARLQTVTAYSPQTHGELKAIRAALWIGAVILLAFVVAFSAGAGRLLSAGLVISAGALPGFVVFSELAQLLHQSVPHLATHSPTLTALLASLGRLLDRELGVLSAWQGGALALGGVLVAGAAVLSLVRTRG